MFLLFLIDNFDLFIYNLVRYFWEFGIDVKVECNNVFNFVDIEVLLFSYIVIFFGFCMFNEFGISLDVIVYF